MLGLEIQASCNQEVTSNRKHGSIQSNR